MAPLREVLQKFNSCPLALPLTVALLLTGALVSPAYPLYRFDPNFRLLLLAAVHGALISLMLSAFAVFWVAGRLRRQADRADLMNTIEISGAGARPRRPIAPAAASAASMSCRPPGWGSDPGRRRLRAL